MSPRAKTPSPQQGPPAVPANTPMAPPATPSSQTTGASTNSDTVPRTPNTKTPGSSLGSPIARTPGGTLKTCSSDPASMTIVKVHTAKCTTCDRRNKDTMLRCPGCAFLICKPCRDDREKKGRSLVHGGMMSPGGLGLGALGSGGAVRRRAIGIAGTPTREAKEESMGGDGDVKMANTGPESAGRGVTGKGKEKAVPAPATAPTSKAASKKRAAKSKPKPTLVEESSDDDFRPDPTSPTSNKRRRTTLAITDTPTATSARPSRTAPASATHPTYVASSSPSSDSSAELAASIGRRPTTLNSMEISKMWNIDVAPPGRLQELLESHGVNTPENRYQEHFLQRYEPVVSSRVAVIPESVRRMADPTPRLSAEQKVDIRNKALREKAAAEVRARTVRGFAESEATKYQNDDLSIDENEELISAAKETGRKWAMRTHDKLPEALQTTVVEGLDMRLDHIDSAYKAHLTKLIEQCAARKLKEFEQDRGSAVPEPDQGNGAS